MVDRPSRQSLSRSLSLSGDEEHRVPPERAQGVFRRGVFFVTKFLSAFGTRRRARKENISHQTGVS